MSIALWTPSEAAVKGANLSRFQGYVRAEFGAPVGDDYETLHRWSLAERGKFWTAVWRFAGVLLSCWR